MKSDKEWKKLIYLILLAVFFNLFFINKAFHIDDFHFIAMARHMVNDPIHPYSFAFEQLSSSNATSITDPPLIPFYYSFFIKYFKESEPVLHASFLLFTVMAIVSIYYVAKRFTKKPLIASILLISTPIFFLMSHNLMVDVPTLAFFLAAIATYVHGVDKDSYAMIFVASFLISLGILIKYSNLVLIPLLAFYSLLNKKYKSILFLIFPVTITLLWSYYTIRLYGSSHLGFVLSYVYSNLTPLAFSFFVRFVNIITNIGGAILVPIFLIYPFILKRENKIAYSISILIALLMTIGLYIFSAKFISGRYTLLQLVLFVIFVTGGLSTLYLFFNYIKKDFIIFFKSFFGKNKINNKIVDNIFLFGWFIGTVLFNVMLISYASRYIILLLPVFIIFYIKILEEQFKNINLSKFFALCIIFTFTLSFLMAINDYQLADSYKVFAENNNLPKTTKIWYNGFHGFQYYMDGQGYEILKRNSNEPKKGDIIVKSVLQAPRQISPELSKRIKLINKIEFNNNFPIRVFNIDAHAGFYSYGAGFLPFSISRAKLDTIEVYEVVR